MDSPLRIARKKRNWSQKEVGDKVGLTAPQVSRIEANGVESSYLKKILHLVKIFDYSITLEEICNPPKEDKTDEAA